MCVLLFLRNKLVEAHHDAGAGLEALLSSDCALCNDVTHVSVFNACHRPTHTLDQIKRLADMSLKLVGQPLKVIGAAKGIRRKTETPFVTKYLLSSDGDPYSLLRGNGQDLVVRCIVKRLDASKIV